MSEKYDQGQRKREKKTQSLLIMDQSYITNYIYTNIIEHKDKKQWINEYLPLRHKFVGCLRIFVFKFDFCANPILLIPV